MGLKADVRDYREAFDAVLPHLEKISQVLVIEGEKAPHYKLNPEFTGEPQFTPGNTSSDAVNHEFTGEPASNVTDLDSRRSHDSAPQTAASWLTEWISKNAGPGGWVKPGEVLAAGKKAGHTTHAIMKAKRLYADPPIESSGKGRESQWRIVRTTQEGTA